MERSQLSSSFLWLIIILLIGAGLYLFVSNNEEVISTFKPAGTERQDTISKTATSNWNTYHNDHYGFMFRYPSNRTVYEIGPDKQWQTPATSQSMSVGVAHQEGAYLSVSDPQAVTFTVIPDTTDAQIWFSRHADEYASRAQIKSISAVTISGKKAIEVRGDASADRLYKLIIVQMSEYLIVAYQNTKSTLLDDVIASFAITK